MKRKEAAKDGSSVITYRHDKQIWLQHGLWINTDMHKFYLNIIRVLIFIWKECSVIKQKQWARSF